MGCSTRGKSKRGQKSARSYVYDIRYDCVQTCPDLWRDIGHKVSRCEFTSHVCAALEYQKRKIYDIAHQELDRWRSTMVSIAS